MKNFQDRIRGFANQMGKMGQVNKNNPDYTPYIMRSMFDSKKDVARMRKGAKLMSDLMEAFSVFQLESIELTFEMGREQPEWYVSHLGLGASLQVSREQISARITDVLNGHASVQGMNGSVFGALQSNALLCDLHRVSNPCRSNPRNSVIRVSRSDVSGAGDYADLAEILFDRWQNQVETIAFRAA